MLDAFGYPALNSMPQRKSETTRRSDLSRLRRFSILNSVITRQKASSQKFVTCFNIEKRPKRDNQYRNEMALAAMRTAFLPFYLLESLWHTGIGADAGICHTPPGLPPHREPPHRTRAAQNRRCS